MSLDFSKYFLPDFSLAFMGALHMFCHSRKWKPAISQIFTILTTYSRVLLTNFPIKQDAQICFLSF